MSDVLSQEAVSALVDAARSGALGDGDPHGRRQRRMRRVDFTRPTKFTGDQQRRLHRTLDAFCRSAGTRLSAELRTPAELEVIDIDQLAWSMAHGGLPRDAIGATLDVGPGRLLLAGEQGFLLAGLERLLGGADRTGAPARRLGDIDWALCGLLFELLLTQLAPVWEDLCGQQMHLDRLEPAAETANLASVSEPTMAITMEVRFLKRSTTMVLLLPYAAIAPVADALGGTDHGPGGDDGIADEADAAVRGVAVTVRAEVARVRRTIGEVAALRPGDVLRLDAPVDAGVRVYADQTAVFRGSPGRLAARRAVQVEARAEDPS
ncbi:MAG: flagellar motor switch protein FliM [Solirubrobacteraceae bacterium]